MNKVIDNSAEFLKKLKPREEGAPIKPVRRRLISMAGGKRRIFAPTVRGEDFMQGGPMDSSGAVSLGRDLPSPSELAEREKKAEREKEFFKNKDKFPQKSPRDGRTKI